ncbi:proton-conducting transporter membrane subunit [Armatimonas sp.]|uniref:proton-conducting transporter transmembrane domain-containing protein n=1 Tax=Armatimonas sp. TaxID=1872638 RepID=UPI00374D041E
MTLLIALLCGIVAVPGVSFLSLGFAWLLGWEPPEKTVTKLTALCYGIVTTLALALALGMAITGQHRVVAELGSWFVVHDYRFPLRLLADSVSLPFQLLGAILVGVVGRFSGSYIHRDPGFFRFFLLLHLFGFGILLLFSAATFDVVIGGWELVGLTSVMLIAFFQHRDEPVKNALRAFATYRTCDIGLLVGVVLLHGQTGSAGFEALSQIHAGEATLLGLLFLLAAMGKGAQVPFSGWLPRAMEGPTPSTAIFYGALSVHAGAYLLLRAQPLLQESRVAAGIVVVVGLATALHGTLAGRAAADTKTGLAHASLTQLGLVFAELGMGWTTLALWHIVGHAAVRTLEFLRAPSMLHDYHHVHAAAGGALSTSGEHYKKLLPESVRHWFYRLALDRGHLDTIVERFLIGPVLRLATGLQRSGKKKTENTHE